MPVRRKPLAARANFGANDYSGARRRTAQPRYRRPRASPMPIRPYAAGADHYHGESEAPGYAPRRTQPAAMTAGAYYPQQMQPAGEDEDYYDDVPPPRRRMGIMAIAAVFALAVIGTAGAFGYRALFGSFRTASAAAGDQGRYQRRARSCRRTPSKAPNNKLIYDRVADHAARRKDRVARGAADRHEAGRRWRCRRRRIAHRRPNSAGGARQRHHFQRAEEDPHHRDPCPGRPAKHTERLPPRRPRHRLRHR